MKKGVIIFLLFPFIINAQQKCQPLPLKINAQYSTQDINFVESFVQSSEYDTVESGMKIGFIDSYTRAGDLSPLLKTITLSDKVTPEYVKENGIPRNQLKDLILTITSLGSVSCAGDRNMKYFTADGSDGNKYNYFFPARPSRNGLNKPILRDVRGVFLPEEYQTFTRQLVGKTVYSKDLLWLTTGGEQFVGLIYHPLKVTKIILGNSLTASDSFGGCYICFVPEGYDDEYCVFIAGSLSRSFYSRLTFRNPKELCESIPDKDWDVIKKGLPVVGMNEEHLELMIGKPDLKTKHQGEKSTFEIWVYEKVNWTESCYILLENKKVKSYSNDRIPYNIIL